MSAWLHPYYQMAVNWWYGLPPQLSERSCFDGCYVMRPINAEWSFVEPLFRDLDLSIEVRQIPDDGNCLFRAFAEYLPDQTTYTAIRTSLADYLAGHFGAEFVQMHIALAIEDHNTRCDKQRDEEALNLAAVHETDKALQTALEELEKATTSKKIVGADAYIEKVRQDRFFGGDVEVYAFSQRYGVPVGVYEKRGDAHSCSIACIPNGTEERPPCILIYNRAKRHYNICLRGLE